MPFWGGRIRDREGQQILLGLHRTRKQGDFEPSELAVLDRVIPHLRRFVGLRAMALKASRPSASQAAALDQLSQPVALVRQGGVVDYANRAAAAILDKGDGLGLRNGRLVAADADMQDRIQKHLGVILLGGFRASQAAVDLIVPKRAAAESYLLTLAPLAAGAPSAQTAGDPMAMVTIVDMAQRPAVSPARLAAAFGLTHAEADLAWHLGSGRSLDDVMQARGVKRSTLRTQLLSVFDKTGVHRQSDLVRLVCRLP